MADIAGDLISAVEAAGGFSLHRFLTARSLAGATVEVDDGGILLTNPDGVWVFVVSGVTGDEGAVVAGIIAVECAIYHGGYVGDGGRVATLNEMMGVAAAMVEARKLGGVLVITGGPGFSRSMAIACRNPIPSDKTYWPSFSVDE